MTTTYRIREPQPGGKFDCWPDTYATIFDAIRALDRIGNSRAEIVDERGEIMVNSRATVAGWKRGRES